LHRISSISDRRRLGHVSGKGGQIKLSWSSAVLFPGNVQPSGFTIAARINGVLIIFGGRRDPFKGTNAKTKKKTEEKNNARVLLLDRYQDTKGFHSIVQAVEHAILRQRRRKNAQFSRGRRQNAPAGNFTYTLSTSASAV
jgi:hypothetical protein